MLPVETDVMVSPLCLCVTARKINLSDVSLGIHREIASLVDYEDVKKPINQPNNKQSY